MSLFFGVVVFAGLAIAWSATFWARREAPRWGLVDHPGGRKAHRAPTPTGGGLAIWLALVGALISGQTVPWAVAGGGGAATGLGVLLAGATAMLVLGLIDDLRALGRRLRLGVQVLVAALAVWQGWPLMGLIASSPWVGVGAALSVIWLVASVNAFNMLDNMDGLSAGVAAIAAAMLMGMLLLMVDHRGWSGAELGAVAFLLALIGALLGFLWHNHTPARIFMGDAGSYLVGFSVGAAALMTASASDCPVWIAAAVLLCVFAVPLYDMVSVVLIRLAQGRSPFLPDRNHLSHRLVALGLSQKHTVWVIYAATAVCGLPALFLPRLDGAAAIAVVLGMGCLVASAAGLEALHRRKRPRTALDTQRAG